MLTVHELRVLSDASFLLRADDVDSYLGLRDAIRARAPGFEGSFRRAFSQFFRLNSGGLTEAFKDRYFELLFAFEGQPGIDDPYSPLLQDLYQLERRKGDKALQCSFVTKLVAIHDDDRPIYDVYVRDFFGLGVPSSNDINFRISGFVRNLGVIREAYRTWQHDDRYRAIVDTTMIRVPQLALCSATKVADMLVWTSGRSRA